MTLRIMTLWLAAAGLAAAAVQVRQQAGQWVLENPGVRVAVDLPAGLTLPDTAPDLFVQADMPDRAAAIEGLRFLDAFALDSPTGAMAVADYVCGEGGRPELPPAAERLRRQGTEDRTVAGPRERASGDVNPRRGVRIHGWEITHPGRGTGCKAGTGSNFAAFAKLRACTRFAPVANRVRRVLHFFQRKQSAAAAFRAGPKGIPPKLSWRASCDVALSVVERGATAVAKFVFTRRLEDSDSALVLVHMA